MSFPQPDPRPDGLAQDEDSRWELMRDVLVLQAKLLLEGLRDVMLGPISIIAGLLGALRKQGDPRQYFRRVLSAGYRFDDWLNLYGPLSRLPEKERRDLFKAPDRNVDRYFARVEQALVEQYARGGITRSAKEAIDALLDGEARKR